ncbi:BTAD domain-containing putative transcriptional regulator [Micromonospora chersina]|uniref:AfsR/SARP family transcriptional regulator n=1 Tax=Micromonospora chersina TaxID=47854 RepID=UPI0037A07F32
MIWLRRKDLADVRLLGAPESWCGSTRLPLGTPKQQLVLAMLALHGGRVVTTDALVDELWPEQPPRSAVANVRTYAGNLRRAFERQDGPGIVRLPGGYRIDLTDEQVDVPRFEQLVDDATTAWSRGAVETAGGLLAQAERLWRGPLAAGLPTGPVLAARRAALDEQHLSAIELRARLELQLGRTRSAIALLTDHVAAHPYREQAHALLARARYADGDPVGALAAVRRAEAILADPLGIEPGIELRTLHQALLDGSPVVTVLPEADTGAATATGRTEPTAGTAASGNHLPRVVSDFVGRRELAERLMAEIAAADGRTSPVRVVDGMAGSGKTAFAVHLAYRLAGRYSDAQLFIDLRGHAESVPVDPADALTALLRQLGVPAGRIPTDHDSRRRCGSAS